MLITPSETRILIAEDTPAVIATLVAALRQQGYQTSVATNGRQALEALAAVRPELILLDVMMPELDGFETCLQIKANPEWKDIPLIFLTSKADPGDIVRGFELGAVDYVAKPFHSHELLARVNTHLAMARLLKENERLVRAECESARHRSVAQMVAGVAHEINTPLGIINTAADLLKNWLSSPILAALAATPDGKTLLEDLLDTGNLIARNATRAHKLVEDFKKVSVHQITDRLENVDLAEVVAETAHLFRVTARQSPMEVTVHNALPEGNGDWLGYPGSLSQVLLNLLSNAQRYAYPEATGGRVEISLAADSPDHFTLSLRDFGRGIPTQDLGRVFEPFFTTGRAKGGSGLGLSIVHSIVTAQLQGSINIESRPAEGTTVRITFPRRL